MSSPTIIDLTDAEAGLIESIMRERAVKLHDQARHYEQLADNVKQLITSTTIQAPDDYEI